MNAIELDKRIKALTEREQFYLDNPEALSPLYEKFETTDIDGNSVYHFRIPELSENEVQIRRDSRFRPVPLHRFSNIMINYVYSGKCRYLINDKIVEMEVGDVCIIDQDVVRYKFELEADDIVFNISLDKKFFSRFIQHNLSESSIVSSFILNSLYSQGKHDQFIFFRNHQNPRIINLFDEILTEYYKQQKYYKSTIKSYIEIVVLEQLRSYQNSDIVLHLPDQKENDFVEILRDIENNYKEGNIEDLANKFHYNPKYLSSLIKKRTGFTFKEIQRKTRLDVSCQLLINSSMTIEEIIEEVGFTNQTSFYNYFKTAYRVSPSEYRKSYDILKS
ncbi:AraC family transcriptional regulator [Fundicoccus culcitae]|uniref:AraC family transcriptional regulator n=1 Tax=Fundicoccus culcitae TaxID=2969821 RepID=A0ABY5P4Q9_9LACT|nr:AraC family transcriptional regulator [Fundicoccus culcitae]UUX33556.1 AraC family transcriptional regulator [Fundicoccus culcitae]